MNKWTKILLCAGLMLGSLAVIGHQPVAQTPEAGSAADGKTDLTTDRAKSVAAKDKPAADSAAKVAQPNGGDPAKSAPGDAKGSADGSQLMVLQSRVEAPMHPRLRPRQLHLK